MNHSAESVCIIMPALSTTEMNSAASLFLAVLLPLVTLPHGSLCQSGYDELPNDYEVLQETLSTTGRNLFRLRTTLFPANTGSPLYLTVTYNFSTTSVDYIWSQSHLYLIVHPHIIRYLSLLFSYIETNRIGHLVLDLPEEWSYLTNNTNSDSTNPLYILTHRVRSAIM